MQQLLTEMPWTTNVKCPFCKFKFGFDARIEAWTQNKNLNKKFLQQFNGIKEMAIKCPNCDKPIVHNFNTQRTLKYDKVIDEINPSIKDFFEASLEFTKPLLTIGTTVIPEKLTFETFVKIQDD